MTSRVLFRADRLRAAGAHVGPILGFDTASPNASLAIVSHGRVLAEITRAATSHGAELPYAVDEILAHAGILLKDLQAIAVGLGPGSFTGLRVGISYAKGLVLALRCALVGISTFDCLAISALERSSAPERTLICSILDARKDEVYASIYQISADGLDKILQPLVIKLQNLLPRLSDGVILIGDSKAKEASVLLDQREIQSTFFDEVEFNSRGRYLAALGAERLSLSDIDSPATLEPLYVRSTEATFKPGAVRSVAAAKERPWSNETNRSSSSC